MALNICDSCGSATRENRDTCANCGDAFPDREDIRRLPHEVVLQFLEHAEDFLAAGPLKQLVLAFMAGAFITFGAMLSVALTTDIEPVGLSRLLLGVGFAAGFVVVILSGSVLFTEINVILPELFLSRTRDLGRRFWRFWLFAYIGNVVGALAVGAMMNGAHLLGPLQEERLFELLEEKMQFKDLGIEGWFIVFGSAILGNWLVGMAAFLATGARTVSGKILGVLFPILTFVAIGVQHAPANMGYFSIGLINGDSGIGWGEAIWWNIVPASLGNMIGGGTFVALLFWYTYGHESKRRESLKQAHQLMQKKSS